MNVYGQSNLGEALEGEVGKQNKRRSLLVEADGAYIL